MTIEQVCDNNLAEFTQTWGFLKVKGVTLPKRFKTSQALGRNQGPEKSESSPSRSCQRMSADVSFSDPASRPQGRAAVCENAGGPGGLSVYKLLRAPLHLMAS